MSFKMKRKFGQNFITDKNLILKIVNGAQINEKNVIEVGPGAGALTNFLAKQALTLTCFEIDIELKEKLESIVQKNNNSKIFFVDFLDIELTDDHFLDQTLQYHLVGNLPYYITTPIIFKFLEAPFILSATIMVQLEVANRIIAQPSSKEYNAFSAIIQYFAVVKKIVNVRRNMFRPIPKVDSAVIRIEKRSTSLFGLDQISENIFLDFIKAVFSQKRKTIVNNIFEKYSLNKETILSCLHRVNINPLIRAEQLSLDNIFMIFNQMKDWLL